MPYIDTDSVKSKRSAILAAFPKKEGWKVSVTREHHSCVRVTFLEGPVALTANSDGYEQINRFHIEKFAASPAAAAVLLKATRLAAAGEEVETVDSDYGTVPTFYVNIHVGRWDVPYRVVAA